MMNHHNIEKMLVCRFYMCPATVQGCGKLCILFTGVGKEGGMCKWLKVTYNDVIRML